MMVRVQIVGASRDVQRAPGARARLCSSSPLCLLVLVSYRPLAPQEALYGSGACGGVFRTEYRGLLRFLAVNPSREIARGTERCPLRAHAVARSGGHRPTHRYPQAAAAACCA